MTQVGRNCDVHTEMLYQKICADIEVFLTFNLTEIFEVALFTYICAYESLTGINQSIKVSGYHCLSTMTWIAYSEIDYRNCDHELQSWVSVVSFV